LPPSSSLKSQVITQAIAIVFFVVVPTVITLIVPFTDLTFLRNAGGASVTVKRYALMVIPWQTTDIANVKTIRADINQSFRYADTAENRRKGRAGAVNHATGQLVILGDDREVIVQAAPEIAEGISAQFKQFLTASTAEPVTVSVYASWRLSYLLGGAMTALAALYVIGACLTILAIPFNRLRGRS
jgi:hypothetical protein